MTYKNDIDKILKKHDDPEYDKGETAYCILEQLGRIRGIIGNKNLDMSKLDCFGLERLRIKIIIPYLKNKINRGEAENKIDAVMITSLCYLVSKGYDPQDIIIIEQYDLWRMQNIEERVESLEKKLREKAKF